jgi:DNA-binding transcriptional regulator YdaS (Cro superfamily)
MTYDQAIKRFKTQTGLALALGTTQSTVSLWKRTGIPARWQYQLEVITDGELKADKPLRQPVQWKMIRVRIDR